MLRGFIDEVSVNRIAGWAADIHRPDDRVDISIVVNGYERARLTAERLREDLRALGIYGDGRHGFAFDFEPPLPTDRRHEILVRFCATKETLEGGRIGLSKDGTERSNGLPLQEPAIASELVEPRLISAPGTCRCLIELFQAFDQRRKLNSIIDRLDFTGTTRRQTYQAVLDRLPTIEELEQQLGDSPPSESFYALLTSDEFQQRITQLVLGAFPEKRRLIFVHVPKCAGTDLTESLSPYYPHLHHHLSLGRFTTKEHLFAALKEISLRLRLCDRVLVTGHVPLAWYLGNALIRYGDRAFTTIRDPREIVVSNANFVTTRLIMFRQDVRADTAEWMKELGLDTIPEDPTSEYTLELARKVLYNPHLTGANMLCKYLGKGSAENTVPQLMISDIEITDTTRYGMWRKRTWGLDDTTRANESLKVLTNETLNKTDWDHIESLTPEDQKLYSFLMERLRRVRGLSIRGSEL